MIPRDIHQLICEYSAEVAEAFRELHATYPSVEIRPLNRTIPRRGTLPSGRTYSFHGIGCLFELQDVVVDMDFGPDGRIDGFDAWRLNLFAESRDQPEWTLDALGNALAELLRDGKVVRLTSALASHLYFPANEGSPSV